MCCWEEKRDQGQRARLGIVGTEPRSWRGQFLPQAVPLWRDHRVVPRAWCWVEVAGANACSEARVLSLSQGKIGPSGLGCLRGMSQGLPTR